MDNFGFSTQGSNYLKFRPLYPQCLYNHTISKIKSHNRYLDIAMGTGQLLFKIAPLFNYTVGIDISNKMLQTSREILQKQYGNMKQKIEIRKCDVMQMNINEQQKYDLITVGQALHWFPVRQALVKMRQLLSQQGKLLILSYYVKGCVQPQLSSSYKQFYSLVKPYFQFDRTQLQQNYTSSSIYPFEQIFPSVIRFSQQVKITMSKQTYVNYLKTYSGYNQYLEKNINKNIDDPIKIIEIGFEKENKDSVTVMMEYFKIECGVK